MLQPIVWTTLTPQQQQTLLQRPTVSLPQDLTTTVSELINTVRTHGDQALFALTQQFDNVALDALRVSPDEFDAAIAQVSPEVMQALEQVIANLTVFHQEQTQANYKVETSPGIVCERLVVPIQRIGLYVPAGSAPLVSTVLMLGVPSRLAACPLRLLCTPPNKAGTVDPYILVAAQLCGIQQVFKVGGAQAIAAMAYGTQSIPKVDKIVGPGNRWVTMAKMLVSLDPGGAQLDMPAGPSEVMVIADGKANPSFVASDLLAQAEHGADSQVVLVCCSQAFASAVNQQLLVQLKTLSRANIIKQALQVSVCIIVDNDLDAITVANSYAPEHLILQIENPNDYLPFIVTAGSVFVGAYAPESVGDYASGTNHVLPTAGFARACSGLSLKDFTRTMSVQTLTPDGLAAIAPTVRVLTSIEGLDAHQNAIDSRLQTRGA